MSFSFGSSNFLSCLVKTSSRTLTAKKVDKPRIGQSELTTRCLRWATHRSKRAFDIRHQPSGCTDDRLKLKHSSNCSSLLVLISRLWHVEISRRRINYERIGDRPIRQLLKYTRCWDPWSLLWANQIGQNNLFRVLISVAFCNFWQPFRSWTVTKQTLYINQAQRALPPLLLIKHEFFLNIKFAKSNERRCVIILTCL